MSSECFLQYLCLPECICAMEKYEKKCTGCFQFDHITWHFYVCVRERERERDRVSSYPDCFEDMVSSAVIKGKVRDN